MDTLIAAGLYIILSLICRQFFHHHPAHIGVKILNHGARRVTQAGQFFMDNTTPNTNNKLTPS